MTKVGLGFGDKTGSNCSKTVLIFDNAWMKRVTASLIISRRRFLINKRALCLNEADNGFAVPFENTEWIEVGLVLGTKLGVKLIAAKLFRFACMKMKRVTASLVILKIQNASISMWIHSSELILWTETWQCFSNIPSKCVDDLVIAIKINVYNGNWEILSQRLRVNPSHAWPTTCESSHAWPDTHDCIPDIPVEDEKLQPTSPTSYIHKPSYVLRTRMA